LQILKAYEGTAWAKGSKVLLMTDGKNRQGKDPLSLIPVANALGITFNVIGYGAPDAVLQQIAKDTGGHSVFARGSATSSAAHIAALSAIAAGVLSGRTTSSTPVSVSI
jgi:hypothetical protein